MKKLLAVAAVGGALVVTSAVGPAPPPGPAPRADFFVEVTNNSPYRVEIGVSHSPNQSRRAGIVPSNATKRLKANWRDTPFVLVITAKGAGAFDNARGGAQNEDAVLYTDLLTVEEGGQLELEIPARLPGPYLRTRRP